MSLANPLWGAPRIHGELLKPGIDIGQTSVAKYMTRRRAPPSQGWRTFLRNHADGIAAMDLFVVPTIFFRPVYDADQASWPAADPVVWGDRASNGRTADRINPQGMRCSYRGIRRTPSKPRAASYMSYYNRTRIHL